MARPRLTTPAEWPWIVLPCVLVLSGWWLWNRFGAGVYPPDISEQGRFSVITYGSDKNPVRQSQLDLFNRSHRQDGVQVQLIPGGSDPKKVPTTSAGGNAPDVIDVFAVEELRMYARKGILRPLNPYLKSVGIDLAQVVWAERAADCRLDNPEWKTGDDPADRFIYYAVPNNLEIPLIFLNQTMYQRVRDDRLAHGLAMPPEPWIDWTWWDYAALARSLQQRTAAGQYLAFGGQAPDFELLTMQIGLAQRGDDPAAFAALSDAQRQDLGIAGLSFADCIAAYRRKDDGSAEIFPNRSALAQAFQFRHDLTNAIGGAPTVTDADQMATSGGFSSSGDMGRFISGVQGMLTVGRWYLGQIRANVAFDWRMNRMPRWVPYAEWARWQAAGMGPGKRDEPWGDADPATRLRGYGCFIGGRLSGLSSSCRQPEKAFSFLRFLIENPSFNRALAIEDGFGANVAIARDYLGQVDPDRPDEAVSRPPAVELAALDRLHRRPVWPWDNFRDGKRKAVQEGLEPTINAAAKPLRAATGAEARPVDYAALAPYGPPLMPTHAGIGEAVSASFAAKLTRLANEGEFQNRQRSWQWPSWPTLAALMVVLGLGGWLGLNALAGKAKP